MAITSPPRTVPGRSSMPAKYLYDFRTDALIIWGWVPLFVLGHLLTRADTATADRALSSLLGWVLLISLLHQPLTLLLVYGDKRQFDLRRACSPGCRRSRSPR
jgi:hypothetical protein